MTAASNASHAAIETVLRPETSAPLSTSTASTWPAAARPCSSCAWPTPQSGQTLDDLTVARHHHYQGRAA